MANGTPKCNPFYKRVRQLYRSVLFLFCIKLRHFYCIFSDSEQSRVKGGLQVFSFIHSDGGVENNTSSSSMHKIKFSLPLAMPI